MDDARRGRQVAALGNVINELVDYMLFLDEAPLKCKVAGTSGFAAGFAARGPVDSRGRSLRQLDLERRLMRYPCSYMIYSDAFEGLPAEAKAAIYRRMWLILSGEMKDARDNDCRRRIGGRWWRFFWRLSGDCRGTFDDCGAGRKPGGRPEGLTPQEG